MGQVLTVLIHAVAFVFCFERWETIFKNLVMGHILRSSVRDYSFE